MALFDPNTPGFNPNEDDQGLSADRVLEFLFGNPEVLQAAVPNPRSAISSLLGLGSKAAKPLLDASGKVVGKTVPKPLTQILGQKAKAAVPSAGGIAKGLGAAGALGLGSIIPGVKETIGGVAGTGAEFVGGALNAVIPKSDKPEEQNRASANKEVVEGSQREGTSNIDQERVGDVLTRSGINITSNESPTDVFGDDIISIKQQQDLLLQEQAGQLGSSKQTLQGAQDEISEATRQLQQQLGIVQQGPEDTFNQQLVSLIGIGLPSALAGSSRGLDAAIGTAGRIKQSAQAKVELSQKRADKLQSRLDTLNKDIFTNQIKQQDATAKLSNQITKNVKDRQSIAQANAKLKKEGLLDPIQTIDTPATTYTNTGFIIDGKQMLRDAKAPALSAEQTKVVEGLATGNEALMDNLSIMEQVFDQTGIISSQNLAEDVTYIDPVTGKEVTRNAGAVLNTLKSAFTLDVKKVEAMGTVDEGMLTLVKGYIDDPVGWGKQIQDTNPFGNASAAVGDQIRNTRDVFNRKKFRTLQGLGIKNISEVNEEFTEGQPDFTKISEDEHQAIIQLSPDNEGRVFKYVDPDDGHKQYLNQDELDAVYRQKRINLRRR